jgi:hypothetical protein
MIHTLKLLVVATTCCSALALAANVSQSVTPKKATEPAKPAAPAAPVVPPAPAVGSAAEAFARIKALAGTWESKVAGVEQKEKSLVTYRVIANGSAVVETLLPGTPEEMETIFHLDGDRLLATHYCAAGNQPRLKAVKITVDSVTFEMLDATNLPDRNAMHMGALRIEFVNANQIKTNWSAFQDGKDLGQTVFELKRVSTPTATAAAGR